MKCLGFILSFFLVAPVCLGQAVTDQKEAERIFKENNKEMETAKLYFAEDTKCRNLMRERKYVEAEKSCRLSVSLAEKLPKSRYMEKHSAYEVLGVVLLRQQKAEEAIVFLNKSLEIAKPNLDETDSETGQVYYFLGQANHLLGKLDLARDFYTKAENIYRIAFKKIDDDEIRQFYPKMIQRILEAHLVAVENAEMKEEAEKIKERLARLKTEFDKYLET